MTDFTTRTESGVTKISNKDGELVAFFSGDSADLMMGVFINGLVHHGGFTLFDENAAQYIVGTVAQLDSAGVEE